MAFSQGLLGPYFLGPSDDLPGSILGPFQDLRATFGHLLVAPAWPIKAFSGPPGDLSGTAKNPKMARKWVKFHLFGLIMMQYTSS